MIVYVDSSILARAYLADEAGHHRARELLYGVDPLVTSSWTWVETSSALARAARGHRIADLPALLAVLDGDLSPAGLVTLLKTDWDAVERRATQIVRDHALRSLDALHLAVADLAARPLADDGVLLGFAGRDAAQADVAEALGFQRV